ncbi:hypothetical protein C8035_v003484 [Colletotrichum spinosum]|uniref:Uncharacterized protein n=1 Tax=Colletotrichum spinosum TaxID=1347390 RepID=A0A4R8PVY8_9PEZI|nr:hypothetical protein C8035_v003484 [Colletotrichum spinosum]
MELGVLLDEGGTTALELGLDELLPTPLTVLETTAVEVPVVDAAGLLELRGDDVDGEADEDEDDGVDEILEVADEALGAALVVAVPAGELEDNTVGDKDEDDDDGEADDVDDEDVEGEADGTDDDEDDKGEVGESEGDDDESVEVMLELGDEEVLGEAVELKEEVSEEVVTVDDPVVGVLDVSEVEELMEPVDVGEVDVVTESEELVEGVAVLVWDDDNDEDDNEDDVLESVDVVLVLDTDELVEVIVLVSDDDDDGDVLEFVDVVLVLDTDELVEVIVLVSKDVVVVVLDVVDATVELELDVVWELRVDEVVDVMVANTVLA